ncbi:VOC family protein [Actinoplanes sp. NPDC051851]|uniref:VOC family protein n=1 Tax=Actinoplanes sp. NPDC051851 TaxID=3154753 RepID=UPI00341851FC
MALRVDLTFDTAHAERLAEFWKLALGYEDEPPPPPFATRDEWAASFDDPEDSGGGAWLHDPAGVGPRLSFLDVPEPKRAKNRMHLDIRVGRSADQWQRIEQKAAELVAAGATILHTTDGHHIVMADPEGNEFCIAP